MSISLEKGSRISLVKPNGGGLKKITMGLGWDAAKPEKKGLLGSIFGGASPIDLDASCVTFEGLAVCDKIYFGNLKRRDQAIVHTGDNRTGDGDGDDESIHVDLDALPASVDTLFFTVNSFTGQTFNEVANAYCRVLDRETGLEIARFELSEKGSHTALIMVKLYREAGEWKLQALGQSSRGGTVNGLIPELKDLL